MAQGQACTLPIGMKLRDVDPVVARWSGTELCLRTRSTPLALERRGSSLHVYGQACTLT
jgi:hypothetical protein